MAPAIRQPPHESPDSPMKPKYQGLNSFLNRVLAGLILIVPLWVTLLAAGFVYRMIDGMLEPVSSSPLFERLFGNAVAGLGILRFLVVVAIGVLILYLLGLISTNFVVIRLYAAGESIVLRIPLLKTIYAMTQQILDLFKSRSTSFKEVVSVEFPGPGSRTIGFVTGHTTLGEDGRDSVSVFVPCAPMPSAGFLLIVPAEKAVRLDISVETAFKILVSAGALTPKEIARADESSMPAPAGDKADRSTDAADALRRASS
jgi:uncharacterized membrane protein